MIEIDNYKRSLEWLQRSIDRLQSHIDDPVSRLSALKSFEVVFNTSEEMLRRAFDEVGGDKLSPYLSVRELIYRAADEGLKFPLNKHWLEYSTALETVLERFSSTADVHLGTELPGMLLRLVTELHVFAVSVEQRVVTRD